MEETPTPVAALAKIIDETPAVLFGPSSSSAYKADRIIKGLNEQGLCVVPISSWARINVYGVVADEIEKQKSTEGFAPSEKSEARATCMEPALSAPYTERLCELDAQASDVFWRIYNKYQGEMRKSFIKAFRGLLDEHHACSLVRVPTDLQLSLVRAAASRAGIVA